MVRAWANVSMFCSTIVNNQAKYKNPSDIKREDLICKIHYVAQGKHITRNIFGLLFFTLTMFSCMNLLKPFWALNYNFPLNCLHKKKFDYLYA